VKKLELCPTLARKLQLREYPQVSSSFFLPYSMLLLVIIAAAGDAVTKAAGHTQHNNYRFMCAVECHVLQAEQTEFFNHI